MNATTGNISKAEQERRTLKDALKGIASVINDSEILRREFCGHSGRDCPHVPEGEMPDVDRCFKCRSFVNEHIGMEAASILKSKGKRKIAAEPVTEDSTTESYEEIVMQAVSQLMEKAISEQLAVDEKVSVLTDELADIGAEIKAFPLNEQQHTRLDRYISITHTLEGMREENLYVQGTKDCFRLLKELGAFA